MTEYDTPPDGFDLERESSRAEQAAKAGIVARSPLAEPDFPTAPVADGAAENGDDDALDAPHDTQTPEEA